MWLSVFAVRESSRPDRPPGVYGAAFADYQEGGVLAYHELLVARLHDAAHRRVRVTDIWVDSVASRDGGRSLWAIPKELADLPLDSSGYGPATRTAFGAVAEGRHVASASFVSVPGAALVRGPLAMATSQERPDGTEVVTPFGGSARPALCRASWRFDPDGPLAFLHGRRPVVSLLLRDVRLTFG